MPTHIVAGPGEMTVEWFNSVLRDAEALAGVRVRDVELEPVGAGVIARMVRAELSYEGDTDAPSSLVVKYPSDDPGSFGLALTMGLYELEVRFYTDIAPLVPDFSVPEKYYAELDEESGRFVLVLEDRSAGTRPGDVLTPCSLDECSAVLGQLVNFQAPLWNSTVLSELSWISDPSRTHRVFDAMPQGLEPFLARFGHGLDEEHVTFFRSVLPHAGRWVRSWGQPTVVQHGDFRTDNFLFATEPDVPEVTVIDFQTVRLGPPGVDAAYFLGSSLSVETRRRSERDLITEYHERLRAAGVEGFDWDDCWKSYREGAMYGVLLFVGTASQVESTERADKLIVDQIRRYADMALDLESAQAAGLL